MARKKVTEGPNRSEFIREQLNANDKLSLKEIRELWASQGYSEPITGGLYYQVRNKLGLKPRRGKRGRPRRVDVATDGASAPVVAAAYRPRGSNSSFLEIEKGLDQLLGVAEKVGDATLSDALRSARRLASARLI